MSSARLQQLAHRLWYGGSGLARVLLPFSWLYGIGVYIRRALYRAGLLPAGQAGVPVIVVGNVTVGGTGKTPLVAWLVEQLRAQGLRPGIISRGYGGQGSASPVLVSAASTVEAVGDEPLLLWQRTGVPVMVCHRRLAAARALAAHGVNVIVADDGLQHYALARDLEIAVVDGGRRFGNGWLLPAGPLREPASRLGSVDLVMVNGEAGEPGWLPFQLRAAVAVGLAGGERRDLAAFAGRKSWSVAGIGHPERFHAELRRRGMEVVPVPVPDHGRVDLAQLRRAEAGWPILMTEKDAVKYGGCTDPDVWYLPVDVEISAESRDAILKPVMALEAR